jgi:hypothetical protein
MTTPAQEQTAAEQLIVQLEAWYFDVQRLVEILLPHFESLDLDPDGKIAVSVALQNTLAKWAARNMRQGGEAARGNQLIDLCPIELTADNAEQYHDKITEALARVLSDHEDDVVEALSEVTVTRTVNATVDVRLDVDVPVALDLDTMDMDVRRSITKQIEESIESGEAVVGDIDDFEVEE